MNLSLPVKNAQGEVVKLDQLLGRYVVLYIYPKDFTPGCTTEACVFRDANDELKELGVEIIGLSQDSPESHQKFLTKHRLNFQLWSDEQGLLLKACGALVEKSIFGKKITGVKRMTLILDPEGQVIKTFLKVKPANHAQEILTYLKTIIK